MKLTRFLVLAAALTGAAFVFAGPSPQFSLRPSTPAKAPASANATAVAAPATAPANVAAVTCTTCACCKKAS